MSFKRRLLRNLGIFGAVLLFAGYFAFSTLLFPPIEGDVEADLSTLAPNTVDFFIARAKLNEAFDEFPTLAAASRVNNTKAWRTFERSPDYEEFQASTGLRDLLDGVEQQLAQLPALPGLEFPAVFGGRDLAIAGNFQGPVIANADWVAYGRLNWWGKLGVSALDYPGLLGLEEQGINAQVGENFVTLSGGGLARPLHITRELDVAAIGTSQAMVEAVADLAQRGGQDSFGQSARYFEDVQNSRLRDDGDELEVFVRVRSLIENMQWSGRWPDPEAQDFTPALLGKLFQAGSMNEIVGLVDFANGIQMELTGELSSELITPVQARLYRPQGFQHPELLEAAGLAPVDCGLFVYAKTSLSELLRQTFLSFEPDLRTLIEDSLRSMGRFQDFEQLVQELDEVMKGRVAVIVRPNDYEYVYDSTNSNDLDPSHDGVPVPAFAVVIWTNESEKARTRIAEYHDLIVQHQKKIGLEGHEPGSSGVFNHDVAGGNKLWEFWSKHIAGTGHLAAVHLTGVDKYVISNTYKMAEQVAQTFLGTDGHDPSLDTLPQFQALVSSAVPSANIAAWVNPKSLAVTRREQAELWAEDQVRARINWNVERPKVEREVLAERFGSVGKSQLNQTQQNEFNMAVNERLDTWLQSVLDEQIPAFLAGIEREIIYSELITGALAMLALDPRSYELSLRAMMKLDE